mmetsp:Transcript_33409/g.102644  ORF Transcript_33409/g.102644 Transcript_33409/m.102644 type:complete len:83 (+) Transcript_33409:18-266(+)
MITRRIVATWLYLLRTLANAQCNKTKYDMWYEKRFWSKLDNTESTIVVKEAKGFWGVSRLLQYPDPPSYGQVMEKAADVCKR